MIQFLCNNMNNKSNTLRLNFSVFQLRFYIKWNIKFWSDWGEMIIARVRVSWLIFPGHKCCRFNMAAMFTSSFTSVINVLFICLRCLFFHSGLLQNTKQKQLQLSHHNDFKCCGWITKWSSSCVYVIVTIDRYERKSWSRAVL